ncbi:plasmid pRiA4b ORF-3 family protein [Microbacterium sp. NPDC055683]
MDPDERLLLRVSLLDVEPEVWRTFEIDGQLSVGHLHSALQIVMGWRESHLHEVREETGAGREPLRWGRPTQDDPDVLDEDAWTIAGAIEESPLLYRYDFGDGWEHRVEIVPGEVSGAGHPPVLLRDGANRAPWEDSGGPHGYDANRAALADPGHPDHASIREWVEETVGPWSPVDPAAFDPLGVQSELNLLFNPGGSGAHPADMSGLVTVDALRGPDDVALDSPLVAYAGELPPPVRMELRQHLHRTGVLAPTGMSPETAARIVRPFAWLVDRVGTDGVDLTSAGWLPPQMVLDGMTELGWLEGWIGKGNREDLTPPMANLRQTATRMGIVRAQKGRLRLGAEAKKAVGDPRRVLRLVARGLYRRLQDAEVDAAVLLLLAFADGTPPAQRWRSIAFGLEMVGWRHPDGDFSPADITSVAGQTEDVLGILFGWRVRMDSPATDDMRLFAREALR